nr:hypothetical protein [Sorangium cellulosum]
MPQGTSSPVTTVSAFTATAPGGPAPSSTRVQPGPGRAMGGLFVRGEQPASAAGSRKQEEEG